MIYREQAPPQELHCWVECAWFVQTEERVPDYRVAPDGCLDVIFDHVEGLRAVGAMTSERCVEVAQAATKAGVRFRPGMARTFLGLPATELTDVVTPLENLWPARAVRELTGQMSGTESMEHAIGLLFKSLELRAKAPNPVQRAIDAMAAANGSLQLDLVAREAGLSPRQFRRRCLEESGLTPKMLARVLRFRHASRLAHSSPRRPDWAGIAAQAQYYDQAHLIRDFRQFTGHAPMSVFSNTAAYLAG